jgi:hypothetical protein
MWCSSAEWIAKNGNWGWAPWDDAIVVSVGKRRKLWYSLIELHISTAHFSPWKKTRKEISEACAIAYQNCAVYSVFPSGMTSYSKIAQFNCECIGRLYCLHNFVTFGIKAGSSTYNNNHVSWLVLEAGYKGKCRKAFSKTSTMTEAMNLFQTE